MNYWERHLGDYARDAGHLSVIEHGAYTLLLDRYYVTEAPLPAEIAQVCRLLRAASKTEREAIEQVLREFFTLTDQGWRHKRCDAEIERYKKRVEHNREVGKLGGRPRKTATQKEPDGFSAGFQTEPEPNPLQTPDTRHQTPDKARALLPDGELPAPSPTAAGAICRAMKQAGLSAVNPGDPRLLALLEQGATEAEFAGIAAEAVAKAKGWAWVLHVLQARRSEAAAIALAPPTPDRRNGAAATPSAEQTIAALDSQRMTDAERVASKEARDRVMATLRPALRPVST